MAPLAFAESNWAVNAFKGHLDAPSLSRWGDGGMGGSNLESLFLWHCTIMWPHHVVWNPWEMGRRRFYTGSELSKCPPRLLLPNSFGILGFSVWGLSLCICKHHNILSLPRLKIQQWNYFKMNMVNVLYPSDVALQSSLYIAAPYSDICLIHSN